MGVHWDGSSLLWPAWWVPHRRNVRKTQITYTVRMVEAQGVDWREAVFDRLKPVTRQGAATIWTVPRDATAELLDGFSKMPRGQGRPGPEGHLVEWCCRRIQCRRNRPVVTQAAWNGKDPVADRTPENVRVGWHTTMVGRKLDQGILVSVVFEDTVIRAVHHGEGESFRRTPMRGARSSAKNHECIGWRESNGTDGDRPRDPVR